MSFLVVRFGRMPRSCAATGSELKKALKKYKTVDFFVKLQKIKKNLWVKISFLDECAPNLEVKKARIMP